jgi:hypothetical protein
VITGAAFVPHPPLLVPDLAAGAAGELASLRRACELALDALYSTAPELIVVLGPAPQNLVYPQDVTGTMRPFGVDLRFSFGAGGASVLPLAHTIAAFLLRGCSAPTEAIGVGRAFAGTAADQHLRALLTPNQVGLLVVADGSARRSRTAPGYFDARAELFDDAVSTALAQGDPLGLAALDTELGDELLCGGTRTWRAAADLNMSPVDARLHYCDAPYGVGYFVASWLAK